MKILHGFILAAIVSTVTSCSTQKRHYTRGLHVEWHHRHGRPAARQTVPERPEPRSHHVAAALRGLSEADAAVFRKPATLLLFSPPTHTQVECDSVTMRNGDIFKARILEISSLEIKFKRCDHADNTVHTVKRSEVAAITYANGTKEVMPVIKVKDPPAISAQYQGNTRNTRRVHPAAWISFIFSIIGLALPLVLLSLTPGLEVLLAAFLILFLCTLLFLASLISGIVAIAGINAGNGKWKGLALAIFGTVISFLYFVFVLFVVAGLF